MLNQAPGPKQPKQRLGPKEGLMIVAALLAGLTGGKKPSEAIAADPALQKKITEMTGQDWSTFDYGGFDDYYTSGKSQPGDAPGYDPRGTSDYSYETPGYDYSYDSNDSTTTDWGVKEDGEEKK